MGKKAKKNRVDVVYSTSNSFDYSYDDDELEETPDNGDQHLKVMLDRKSRKGKTVTLVTGFIGAEEDLKELGKFLKSKCGVGGTAKDEEIIIQGDFKQKVFDLLIAEGYNVKKVGGN